MRLLHRGKGDKKSATALQRDRPAGGGPDETLAYLERVLEEARQGFQWAAPGYLESVAILLAQRGEGDGAAQLCGGVEAAREKTGDAPSPEMRTVHEQTVALARAQLGEKQFSAARARGRAMSLDQAITYALGAIQAAQRG